MLHDEIDKNKSWHFYGITLDGDELEWLIATNIYITENDLLKYWNQIEPHLFFAYGNLVSFAEYDTLGVDSDEADITEFIELMEV
jgi:hypothetical protein